MMCFVLILVGPVVFGQTAQEPMSDTPVVIDLFVSGTEGYHTYRIPSIIATPKGTLLAFCEGRKNSRGDSGDIDLLLKRSEDNGKTWSRSQIVWDDAENTCGNPCAVVDAETGKIWLFSTWNLGTDHEKEIGAGTSKDTRRVYVLHSDDEGENWSAPLDITQEAKKDTWRWYATGPGVGIQLLHGPRKGRLIIPGNHSYPECEPKNNMGGHVLYSDDHGENWRISEPIQPGINESQVVELSDGRVMLNSRNYRYKGTRAVTISPDGGQQWPYISYISELQEPQCQASILRYSPNSFSPKSILLFSNPNHGSKRINMSVRLSLDEGQTWPIAKTLCDSHSAYSCLVVLPDGRIGCLYEAGEKHPYEKIVLHAVSLDWLMDGNEKR